MATSNIYKHYLRALTYWPKDPLRPEVSFQSKMKHRIDTRFGAGQAQTSSETRTPEQQEEAHSAGSKMSDRAEMEQVNALYSLLENRYSQKYPLSKEFMQPLSNPSHYYDLLAELEQAPQRNWLQRWVNKWKGAVRFS